LIRYLLRNKHTSPFEMIETQWYVKAPIFVFRQWHRHRTWSYNEVSARYSVLPCEFYIPHVLNEQSKDNKQGSGGPLSDSGKLKSEMQESCNASYKQYERLLEAGVSREIARSVLPVNIYSKMIAKVDLWNLMHFLNLRLHPHAQGEIRSLAKQMHKLAALKFPLAMEAFDDYILGAMSLSVLEQEGTVDNMSKREQLEYESKTNILTDSGLLLNPQG